VTHDIIPSLFHPEVAPPAAAAVRPAATSGDDGTAGLDR
jgi:hypothetical protein